MATTTNYGWTTPDNTAYVKDGASAIRSLGSSVDTSLFSALNGRSAGAVLLNASTLTASTSTVISNVFTSSYANYRIVFRLTMSGNVTPLFRFATSGTANANTNYRVTAFFATPAFTSYNGLYDNLANMGTSTSTGATYFGTIDVFNPQASTPTSFKSESAGSIASGVGVLYYGGGTFEPSTVFDGFSISAASGTITGTARIYGQKDA